MMSKQSFTGLLANISRVSHWRKQVIAWWQSDIIDSFLVLDTPPFSHAEWVITYP